MLQGVLLQRDGSRDDTFLIATYHGIATVRLCGNACRHRSSANANLVPIRLVRTLRSNFRVNQEGMTTKVRSKRAMILFQLWRPCNSFPILQHVLRNVKRRVRMGTLRLLHVHRRPRIHVKEYLGTRDGVFLRRHRTRGIIPTPRAIRRVGEFRVRFRTPILRLPRVGCLISRTGRSVCVLFRRLRRLTQLSIRNTINGGLLCKVNCRHRQDARVIQGVHRRRRLNVHDLLRFVKGLFWLQLLCFRRFLLLCWLNFLFLRFLFLRKRLAIRPILNARKRMSDRRRTSRRR